MSKRESINQEPLTIEELKTMAGLPVWCPEEEAYGIVMCDKIGQWAESHSCMESGTATMTE